VFFQKRKKADEGRDKSRDLQNDGRSHVRLFIARLKNPKKKKKIGRIDVDL